MSKSLRTTVKLQYILLLLSLFSACASTHPLHSIVQEPAEIEKSDDTIAVQQPSEENEAEFEEEREETIADPLEPWNRAMFTFNDKLYFWIMKPVFKHYNLMIPEEGRQSVRNFFSNIAMPIRFVSSLLQADIKGAGTELLRFSINTVIGFLGLFDVAKINFKIEPQHKDIGQTFGKYGIGEGVYLVWPFLGPSTARDTIGFAGEIFLSPMTYIHPTEDAAAIGGVDYFNRASLDSSQYEELVNSAVEPYAALKNAYIQHRRSLIKEK